MGPFASKQTIFFIGNMSGAFFKNVFFDIIQNRATLLRHTLNDTWF